MSNRRPYFNLKESILELFKTRAYYLKEFSSKFSTFEKPYLEGEYQPMHLRLPRPDWKWPGAGDGPGAEKGRKVKFVFDEGECSLWAFSGACGELVEVGGWIGLAPIGSENAKISWEAWSSNVDLGRILFVIPSLDGLSVDIWVQLSNTLTGTVVICARAELSEGYYLKEIEYTIPAWMGGPYWTPRLEWAMKNLTPIWQTTQRPSWDCGCVEIDVSCCADDGMAWDYVVSAETVAANSSCTVAITDSEATGSPYTWEVSGTGFWFNAGHTITTIESEGLSVTLYTDATACGPATITVSGYGCEQEAVTGYVRCTTGSWLPAVSICGAYGTGNYCTYTKDKYLYIPYCGCWEETECGDCPNELCTPACGTWCTDVCAPCFASSGNCLYGVAETKTREWTC